MDARTRTIQETTMDTEDYDGYEWMTHPCAHCGTALSDQPGPEGWPFAYCRECQETQRCSHGVLFKDDCNECNVLSDFAYDAWREKR